MVQNNNTTPSKEALKRGIALNTRLLGVSMGLGVGFLLFCATIFSMIVHGKDGGGYLNLLGIFLPGYSVSPLGAFIGFFWAALFAGLSGAFVYRIYVRSLGQEVARFVLYRKDAVRPPTRLTMRLSARAFGTAIGALMAVQLFLTTNFLVFRGTADESTHAELLAHYLPGYSVSFAGSVIGAFWIFLFTFAYAAIVSILYNWVARRA
jgi:hypothetical protein